MHSDIHTNFQTIRQESHGSVMHRPGSKRAMVRQKELECLAAHTLAMCVTLWPSVEYIAIEEAFAEFVIVDHTVGFSHLDKIQSMIHCCKDRVALPWGVLRPNNYGKHVYMCSNEIQRKPCKSVHRRIIHQTWIPR